MVRYATRVGVALLSISLVLGLAGGASAQDFEPSPSPARRSDEARVRFGASLGTGFGNADVRNNPMLPADVHGRIGVQLNDWFAVYYQAMVRVAFELRLCILACDGQSGVDVVHASTVMAEATLGDGFQVAAGPTVVVGSGGMGTAAGLGLTGRVGWTFGGTGEGPRQGFSIALQPNGGWYVTQPGGYFDMTLVLGWDSF
ncbi:MAG TPA: hypothetical protein VIL20_03080 [Sandaracinaceae bacterium]